MKDIVLSLIGFFVFVTLLVVAIWFGAFLLLFVFATSFFLAVYIMMRGSYLRWRHKGSYAEPQPDNLNQVGQGQTTIIDVEYTDISDKK
ncbi:MAG: hypothetical protein AABY33_02530 [Pseudomonadota bacterium]